jgi:hypothetical protein
MDIMKISLGAKAYLNEGGTISKSLSLKKWSK